MPMSPIRLQNVAESFLLQLRADGRSEHTIGQYRRHVRALDAWLTATRRPSTVADIDHQTLALFLVDDAARMGPNGQSKRAGSMNALRTSLRVFFAYAQAAGHVPENPARLIRRARCAPPPPRALSPGDIQRLLAALDGHPGDTSRRDGVLIRLLVGTGLRLSSALALRTDDIDLERGELAVRCTKGDRPLVLPMSKDVARDLRAYLRGRPDGLLFPGGGGQPLTRRQAARRIAAWAKVAGLAGRVSAHVLRHCFATALYEQTGDVLVVQRALGHRSVDSTMVYATVGEGRLRAALRGSSGRRT